jgi:hypothetical protein
MYIDNSLILIFYWRETFELIGNSMDFAYIPFFLSKTSFFNVKKKKKKKKNTLKVHNCTLTCY